MTQQYQFGDRVLHQGYGAGVITHRQESGGYYYVLFANSIEDWVPQEDLKPAPPLPAWISVNDALPEPGTPVHAVFNGHVGVFVRCPDDEGGWLWARCYGYSSFDNWGDWMQDDDYQSITHWQPLPKPPCEAKTP